MQFGTWIMVAVCVIWFILFGYFTKRDLSAENKKAAALAKGEKIDPFAFSGEKARKEAKEQYEKDAVAKKYFDENGITPFLTEE